MRKLRLWLGIGILGIGLFDLNPARVIDIIPKPTPVVPVLVIDQPTDSLVNLTKPVADILTKREDRVEFAIFTFEASERLASEKYANLNVQTFNDVLVFAGKEYLTAPVSSKYPEFSVAFKDLIVKTIGDDDVYLEGKAKDLSEVFRALSWNLIQN
jgi:hypothetical protein